MLLRSRFGWIVRYLEVLGATHTGIYFLHYNGAVLLASPMLLKNLTMPPSRVLPERLRRKSVAKLLDQLPSRDLIIHT